MEQTLSTPYFDFDHCPIEQCISEHLCYDHRLAQEVAQPLFDAGVRVAAITARDDYGNSSGLMSPPYHFLAMVIQGQMSLGMKTGPQTVGPGELMVCPMGTHHRLATTEKPARWLYFQLEDVPVWEPLKDHNIVVRHYESAALMVLLMRDILDALNHPGPIARQRAQIHSHALVNLLRHELAVMGVQPSSRKEDLQRLVSVIRQAPADDWSRSRLADELHLSVRQLTRLFQKEFGSSPKDFVIRQRMTIATELLQNTDNKVETIAHEVGYASVYSFSRLFSKIIGLSPGKYRTRYGQMNS